MNRLESEFSSYKVRAHALLQKKEAELAAAVDSDQIKALEEALKVRTHVNVKSIAMLICELASLIKLCIIGG